jgi:hypothetical protein
MGPFRSISAFIYRVSTRPVVLTALAGFIAFMIFVLPAQANQAEGYAGGAGSPDTSFFYTPTDLYEMAEAYGPDGRAAYVQARYTFDVVWPLVYLAFLATTISWILARLIRPGNPWRLLNLVPVLATLFDFLENTFASVVMLRYPVTTPIVDWLAPLSTMLKWSFISVSFLLIPLGLLALLARGQAKEVKSTH